MKRILLSVAVILCMQTVQAEESDLKGSAGIDPRLWYPIIRSMFVQPSDRGSTATSYEVPITQILSMESASMDLLRDWDNLKDEIAIRPQGYPDGVPVYSGWGAHIEELLKEPTFVGFWRHRDLDTREGAEKPLGIVKYIYDVDAELHIEFDAILTGTRPMERELFLQDPTRFRVVAVDLGIYKVSDDPDDYRGPVNCDPQNEDTDLFPDPNRPCKRVYTWKKFDDPFLLGDRFTFDEFRNLFVLNNDNYKRRDSAVLGIPAKTLKKGAYEARFSFTVRGRFNQGAEEDFPSEDKTASGAVRFGIVDKLFGIQSMQQN